MAEYGLIQALALRTLARRCTCSGTSGVGYPPRGFTSLLEAFQNR
jgi:hypothetical protein